MPLPGATSLWNALSSRGPTGGQTTSATALQLPGTAGYPRPLTNHPGRDQIVQDIYPQPWRSPLDMANYGAETAEMRAGFRYFYLTEPTVRSAIDGLTATVAISDVSVIPEDKDRPTDQAAAEFVDWAVRKSEQGWKRVIENVVKPALIDGYSLNEITNNVVLDSAKWHGMWGLKHVRNLDTANLRLQLDVYRNVTGIVNLIRGIEDYNPEKTILFSVSELYNNSFGYSPLRAAYRAANLIADAYAMWSIALRNYSEPYAHGKVAQPGSRRQMEEALKSLRGSGWCVTPETDSIELLNLASATSLDAFEKKIRILREDILLAIRGAYTPFVQGGAKGDTRNDSGVSKASGSDPLEESLALDVSQVLTHQLCPALVRPGDNFPADVGMPRVVLGGVDWGELDKRLKIITGAKAAGFSVSKDWGQGVLHLQSARDPADELPGAQAGAVGADGLPTGGGKPGGLGGNPALDPNAPPPKADGSAGVNVKPGAELAGDVDAQVKSAIGEWAAV